MIKFYGSKPLAVNHACKQCVNNCKQHKDVRLICCPFFEKICKKDQKQKNCDTS